MKKKILLSVSVLTLTAMMAFTNINTILGSSGVGGGTDPQCTSGGPGSTSCSGSWILLGATISCDVSCGPGYYACCYLGWDLEAHCVCKSNSSSST